MNRGAPPLRFLLLVMLAWVGFRATVLIPRGGDEGVAAPVGPTDMLAAAPPQPCCLAATAAPAPSPPPGLQFARTAYPLPMRGADVARATIFPAPSEDAPGRDSAPHPLLLAETPLPPPPPPFGESPGARRWWFSAWGFLRRGESNPLAAAGLLGGSQAGFRFGYRLNDDSARPLSLSLRAHAPLEVRGAEAAIGIEWKPIAAVPVRVLAERRQALDDAGRSAFSLMALGGGSVAPGGGRLRIDAYGQAGLVGLGARDLFADGSLVAGMAMDPAARLELGAGLWGAAQPGAARLDAGPRLRLRLPLAGPATSLTADWRFRLAGDASPRSGPALTLAVDF